MIKPNFTETSTRNKMDAHLMWSPPLQITPPQPCLHLSTHRYTPIGLLSKVVHYIGKRVLFRTHPVRGSLYSLIGCVYTGRPILGVLPLIDLLTNQVRSFSTNWSKDQNGTACVNSHIDLTATLWITAS